MALREAALGRVNGTNVLQHEKLLMHDVDPTSTCLVPKHLISGMQDFLDMFAKDVDKKRTRVKHVWASSWRGGTIIRLVIVGC